MNKFKALFILFCAISACQNNEIQIVTESSNYSELRQMYKKEFNANEVKLYFAEVPKPVYRSFTIEFIFKSESIVKLPNRKVLLEIAMSFYEKLSSEEIEKIDYIDIYFSTWNDSVIWNQGHVEIEQFPIDQF